MSSSVGASVRSGMERSGPAAAWFAFLGGPIAWTFHLLLCYAITEFGCAGDAAPSTLLGVSVIAWAILAVSLVTFVMAAAATAIAWRQQPDRSAPREPTDEPGSGADYLLRAGVPMGVLSALVIAAQTLPILFYLRGC